MEGHFNGSACLSCPVSVLAVFPTFTRNPDTLLTVIEGQAVNLSFTDSSVAEPLVTGNDIVWRLPSGEELLSSANVVFSASRQQVSILSASIFDHFGVFEVNITTEAGGGVVSFSVNVTCKFSLANIQKCDCCTNEFKVDMKSGVCSLCCTVKFRLVLEG